MMLNTVRKITPNTLKIFKNKLGVNSLVIYFSLTKRKLAMAMAIIGATTNEIAVAKSISVLKPFGLFEKSKK